MEKKQLEPLCRLLRRNILISTTEAGSGHPTSSMSAVELAATLFFKGFFHFNPDDPKAITNDRFILSKGHASPLLYSLYHAAGWITEKDLMSLRTFDSIYEGHPTPRIPFIDVATGSLGQGLSVGVGMALAMRTRFTNHESRIKEGKAIIQNSDFILPKVFVLLGDSEVAEGQVWEAAEIASYYKLNNLVAILDVNRLGQRGQTMEGWDLDRYQKRFEAFGWNTIVIDDGHDLEKVNKAYSVILNASEGSLANASSDKLRDSSSSTQNDKPWIIIAKTDKGHGVSFLQNKDDWHGKPVPKDKLQAALDELGKVDLKVRGVVQKPQNVIASEAKQSSNKIATSLSAPRNDGKTLHAASYKLGNLIATREAYGEALTSIGATDERIVAFDGEVSNSTYSDKFKKAFPNRFFEMFIAEQNMVSAALGASKMGLIPFASSFAAFLTRAYDQIRVAQYSGNYESRITNNRKNHNSKFIIHNSGPNLKIVGSHAGVSIGQDGPSQMALEDLAMMRAVEGAVIFYPSDATSTAALTQIMAKTDGLFYMRTTREKTPVIYSANEKFKTGGSKIVFQSKKDAAVIFAAGITLHEAIKAHDLLEREGIQIAVVDLYSVKPIDNLTIQQFSNLTKNVIVVEDHYAAGALGEAVISALISSLPNYSKQAPRPKSQKDLDQLGIRNFTHLCVRKLPRSGSPAELLRFEEIDAEAIISAVKKLQ